MLIISRHFRNVFAIVKALDEQKSNFSSLPSLFQNEDITGPRQKLLGLIDAILMEDFENVGKKTREILWRKVYYDPISISKRLRKQHADDKDETFQLLVNFIKNAIKHYKTLILKFEDLFSLDLRYIIDFGIIANGADAFEKRSEKELYTLNEINYALETIHAFLVCLGDLHRYCIEFNFAEKDVSINTSKELASKYYIEAFKLNPKVGMPHNQLGTLAGGTNQEIDSIFHYLYSLCSPVPFELSELNVNRIFQQNLEALEKVKPSSTSDGFNEKEFMMQMVLVIDIFYYDKDIADFNSICRSVLVSFKEYLSKNRRHHQVDLTFQLTSIFMICLLKLKLNNSPKVHSLNAFLVAFCAEMIEVAISKVDSYIADHKDENLQFCDEYNKKFIEFDKKIKLARDANRGIVKSKQSESIKDSGSEKNENQLSMDSNKPSTSETSDKVPLKIVKRAVQPTLLAPAQQPNACRRRRKRRGGTNSSDESEDDSYSISEYENSDAESMNSDFDSYDEQDDYRCSSDDENFGEEAERKQTGSDNDDVYIENEEIVYCDGKAANEKLTNGDHQNNFYSFQESDGLSGSGEHSNDDVVIEDETLVFRNEGDDESHKGMKMKYKKKYTKVNPNLIIRFGDTHAAWMQSLKVLFDWLRLNPEIVVSCYHSNPEFINKIMKLINFLNIDIFTRKIYFDRSLIVIANVRADLRHLFDIRHQIATYEDIVFKKCLLFEELQQPLDWELNYKLQITPQEDVIIRNFKIIDFGFHLCKMKKFHYSFCARNRVFIEKFGRRHDRRNRKERDEKSSRKRPTRRERRRNRQQQRRNGKEHERASGGIESQEEFPSIEQSQKSSVRKGYLRNRSTGAEEVKDKENQAQNEAKQIEKKNELMGKLWLKSEIKTLESRKISGSVTLTPYLMVDSKSLTEHLNIIKNLVKTRKFVLLIPKAGKQPTLNFS